MRRIAVVAILLMLLASSGMAFAFQNEPRGFRGLRWGQRRTPDMVLIDENPNAKVYTRPDDDLTLGGAKLGRIGYIFLDQGYRQSFMAVCLQFNDKENYNILVNVCRKRFGKPDKKVLYELLWVGNKGAVQLDYNAFSQKGHLIMSDRRLTGIYDPAKGKEAEKGW